MIYELISTRSHLPLPPKPDPSTLTSTSFVGRTRCLQASSNRQQMLQDIQAELYSTIAASDVDEVDEWLNSAPIQESVPDRMTAEQDVKWLMAWWRTNRTRYSRMAKIARRYLSVPASEVGVERLFSRGRNLLGLRRYALQPATIKMLTVLKAFQSNKHWLEAMTDLREEVIDADIDLDIELISK